VDEQLCAVFGGRGGDCAGRLQRAGGWQAEALAAIAGVVDVAVVCVWSECDCRLYDLGRAGEVCRVLQGDRRGGSETEFVVDGVPAWVFARELYGVDFAGVWVGGCGGLLFAELGYVAEGDFLEDVAAEVRQQKL